MFDLETRREKHLELLEREARLKERNKKTIKFIPKLIRTLGMKRFSEQVMVMVMMILMDLMMMMMTPPRPSSRPTPSWSTSGGCSRPRTTSSTL